MGDGGSRRGIKPVVSPPAAATNNGIVVHNGDTIDAEFFDGPADFGRRGDIVAAQPVDASFVARAPHGSEVDDVSQDVIDAEVVSFWDDVIREVAKTTALVAVKKVRRLL